MLRAFTLAERASARNTAMLPRFRLLSHSRQMGVDARDDEAHFSQYRLFGAQMGAGLFCHYRKFTRRQYFQREGLCHILR